MEGYEPSTYGERIADIYDAWYGSHPTTDSAVERLASLASGTRTRRVLELGIGSGRLAVPLHEKGFDVWGVDASPAMVEQLRAKVSAADMPVAIGDMAALDVSSLPDGEHARFGVVVVAINTFFNLVTYDAQLACLRRVHDVLDDDGVFVIEAFVPALDHPTNVVETLSIELDRVVLTASRHDPTAQVVESQMIDISEDGIRLRPLVIRYAKPDQLDEMASSAGLALQERWSDWNGTAFADEDAVHVSVYSRR